MRSVCFTMVKNEEDIIESFVRHTLSMVNHLYIADNLSTDGTSSILQALVAEGLPLTVTVDAEQALLQNVKMTTMYRKYAEKDKFDFAFFLDADEFLELDKQVMESVHSSFGPARAFYIPRINYLYTGDPTPGVPRSIFESMTTLDTVQLTPKSMIFHDDTGCGQFNIGNGNHYVRDAARGNAVVSEEQPEDFARMLHFPIRSINQYLSKSLLGWLALQLRQPGANEAKQAIGGHWRTQYRLILKENADITEELLIKNLYGNKLVDRRGGEKLFTPTFPIRYAHLIQNGSVMVQLVKMYEQTIDGLWAERTNWEQHLESLRVQSQARESSLS